MKLFEYSKKKVTILKRPGTYGNTYDVCGSTYIDVDECYYDRSMNYVEWFQRNKPVVNMLVYLTDGTFIKLDDSCELIHKITYRLVLFRYVAIEFTV